MVRHRAKITKGPGSRGAGLAMAFKVIESVLELFPPDVPESNLPYRTAARACQVLS